MSFAEVVKKKKIYTVVDNKSTPLTNCSGRPPCWIGKLELSYMPIQLLLSFPGNLEYWLGCHTL